MHIYNMTDAGAMQVSVLDGNKYTTMCREAGEQCLEILEECRVGSNP